ncbi:MAG TPA: hypothetical protein VFD74_08290 [Thermoleophilia bacterium]|nr:hypothetical protein [Thermoleophilia bacterium]
MSEWTRGPSASPGRPDDPYALLLAELDESVRALKQAARRLRHSAQGIPAVECNADRILASTRMLEINISDLLRDPDSLASFDRDSRVE